MKSKFLSLAVLSALLLSNVQIAAAAYPSGATITTWPISSGTDVDSNITATIPSFEPSGLAWNTVTDQFWGVGDGGQLVTFDRDGNNFDYWTTGGDLEDITIVDNNSSIVYLANEDGYIFSYDTSTSSTVQSWGINSWMPETGGAGMEGLAYVDGYFYAGYQADGLIYILDLSGTTASLVGTLNPLPGCTDISGLHYVNGKLFVLYDGNNLMVRMTPDGTVEEVYTSVAGADQEGLAFADDRDGDGDADLYIAQDTGGIIAYDGFPLPLPATEPEPTPAPEPTPVDADSDGATEETDCNDSDATVSVNQTYYADLDGDGLGNATNTTSICSSTATSGYVTNSSDVNDTDYDNDGISTGTDCNDNDATLTTNSVYYMDADGDGLGFGAGIGFCAISIPSGYVTNSSDVNDTDYDNDGVSTGTDCNDRDSTISANQTYYVDTDRDGLGFGTGAGFCSLSAPSGYVTNNSDANDSDHDNDGIPTATDCNDNSTAITTGRTFYLDADGDGLGSKTTTTTVCSLSAPTGYVINSKDTNDSIPNAGVEIAGDGVDNDGDRRVDEYNTLKENGAHPYYGALDPTSSPVGNIISVSGLSSGYILVTYGDNSVYKYRIFSVSTATSTTISYSSDSAYLTVYLGKRVKTINGYTGS